MTDDNLKVEQRTESHQTITMPSLLSLLLYLLLFSCSVFVWKLIIFG